MGLNLSEVHKDIKKELETRMDIKKRSPGIYFRSTWMRMWSTSDKKKMISGGLLDNGKTRSGFDKLYSPKTEDGSKPSYRPTSGITELSVDYKGDYGSTRSATIQWICWSFQELKELQTYFLREGKTVVIEWGWSKGDKSKVTGLNPDKICDVWKSEGKIRKEVLKSSGNFDAMIGLISGWKWNVQDDGSIKCTTDLIGHGSKAMEQTESGVETQKEGDKEKMKAFTADLFAKLKSKKYCGKDNTWTGKDGSAAQYIDDENAYVSWGFIEDEIVTKHMKVKTEGAEIAVMKSVSYGPDGKKDGLTLIFRPKKLKTTDGKVLDIDRKSPFTAFKVKEADGAPLRNLAIHARIVIDAFEVNDTLTAALEHIFSEINSVACDVWDFRIVDHEEKPGQFGVMDANWTLNKVSKMKDTAFVFPTWSNNSIVRSQALDCAMPDEVMLTTMFGSEIPDKPEEIADGKTIGVVKVAEKLNKEGDGKPDECLKKPKLAPDAEKVKNKTDSTVDTAQGDSEQSKDNATNKERKKDPGVDASKTSEEEKDICSGVKEEMVKKVQFVYPISLELDIDGISGLQWGNAVHTEFIPKVYKDNVVFQVTAVNHTVNSNDWVTKVVTVARCSGS